ncbi:MAG: RNA-binding protein, partial [Nanoarchaeota archaeon]|nr:RNA-binding protein [Nanoarchaeota archaeon]
MSIEQKDHILDFLEKGIRFDGRKLDEYRPIKIERGFSENAEGSARVTIGDTEVLAGVKMSIMEPYPDTPDEGTMMINVELLPLSNPDFEPGPPGIQAIEIARVVDRGIRESKAIDTKKLCLKKREKVWSITVDICPIND